jgi:hypothetical protein
MHPSTASRHYQKYLNNQKHRAPAWFLWIDSVSRSLLRRIWIENKYLLIVNCGASL